MIVDLVGWSRFFLGVAMSLAVSLAIGRAVLTGADVIVGFSGLSLW